MSSDPRDLMGNIVGPGGPHDTGGVVLDARRAVILDACTVSTIDEGAPAGTLAMLLSGRVNRTQDYAQVLFVFGTDGAAAVITELLGLCVRAPNVDHQRFIAEVFARLDELPDKP